MRTSRSNKTPSVPLSQRGKLEPPLYERGGRGSWLGIRTPFARRVYAIVSKIPKGKTMNYGQVASTAGKPRAARAVGNILNKNRDKRIPCHRVIKADGSIGGYAWGTTKKQKILRREGAI